MNIEHSTHGAVAVVRPRGPVADADAEKVETALRRVHQESLGRFVVDASAITFIDGRGIEALLDTTDRLAESGRALKLCGTNETVREVLELTEVASMFEHFADVNSAVRSFL